MKIELWKFRFEINDEILGWIILAVALAYGAILLGQAVVWMNTLERDNIFTCSQKTDISICQQIFD